MPKYKLRLPARGDYLHDDSGSPWFIGETADEAHEFFADEWCSPTEWVHPVILRGHILYKAEIDAGDGHEDAEPGDTTFTITTQDSEQAMDRELRSDEVRAWLPGPPTPWWTYGPNAYTQESTYHATIERETLGTDYPSREAARAAVEQAVAERVEAWKREHPQFFRPLPEDENEATSEATKGAITSVHGASRC